VIARIAGVAEESTAEFGRTLPDSDARGHALPREFYDRNPIEVAHDVLGLWLVHVSGGVRRIGRIVEVEAYLGPHDLAAHSSRGRTKRTEVMFGPPGHSYVYLVYGMYHCMNLVTEPEGRASAVLLRALEPVSGLAESASGPGRLCRAMRIDLRRNAHDLVSRDLYLRAPPARESFSIARTRRVGVDYAGSWARRLLRFYIKGNRFVSRR
jgi:DNA-3-methyladenine glycosylase